MSVIICDSVEDDDYYDGPITCLVCSGADVYFVCLVAFDPNARGSPPAVVSRMHCVLYANARFRRKWGKRNDGRRVGRMPRRWLCAYIRRSCKEGRTWLTPDQPSAGKPIRVMPFDGRSRELAAAIGANQIYRAMSRTNLDRWLRAPEGGDKS